MDAFIVQGGAGSAQLQGSVHVAGAKNSVLSIMAGSLLVEGEIVLSNVPAIADVQSMGALLEGLGAYITHHKDGILSLRTQDAHGTVFDTDVAKRLRASVLLVGSTLARSGKVIFPHPGGCVLGSRPIDLFLKGFETLGCTVTEDEHSYTISADRGISGGDIFFRVVSVTATETFMIAGTKANTPVTLKNCAMEPEVVALANFLKACGAHIEGAGTPTIIIHPSHLESPKEAFPIIPDRIEAGSFLILGALLGKDVEIIGAHSGDLESVIESLREMGVVIEEKENTLRVSRPSTLKAIDIRTHEHPGFPTDLQAPMAVLLTQAEGESSILETVFDGRLNYTGDLVSMGADIRVWNPHKATIKGPTPLKARDINGPDIRAGLAFLLAAATARGESKIGNAHLIDRGYERIEEKLKALGLSIERTEA